LESTYSTVFTMADFESLYHYGYGNIQGDLPFRHRKLFSLARQVYELCRTPNLIHDLSLPSLELFPTLGEVLELINIKFELERDQQVRDSCTHPPANATREIRVDIFYKREEMQQCPQFIESRISHELTHAIRAGIVSLANSKLAVAGLSSVYHIRTPSKAPNERVTMNTDHLYKLEQADFHSGYLIEHMLYGGVIVQLTGCYFFPPNASHTPTVYEILDEDPMFVKIVSREPKARGCIDNNGDLVDYDRLQCFVFDAHTFNSSVRDPVIVYHFGSRITHSQ